MFCHKCGKQLFDGSEYCSYCGAPVPTAVTHILQEAQTSAQSSAPQTSSPTCYAPPKGYEYTPNVTQKKHLGWYYFVLYFLLFAVITTSIIGLVVNIIDIINYSPYIYSSDYLILSIFAVLYFLAIISLAVYTWFRLKNFRKNALKWLYTVLSANAAWFIISAIIAFIRAGWDFSNIYPNFISIVLFFIRVTFLVLTIVFLGRQKKYFVH